VVGRLRLEAASHRAFFEDRFQDLNRKQYSLLAYFMHHCDRVVSRGMLLENVWNYSFDPGTNVVESNVSRLRSRLEDLGCDPIETLRGEGIASTQCDVDDTRMSQGA
jgi:two-component system OmpR family response regulator